MESIRLDKWLWAARFFKTRARAATAVSGGKVHLNGKRVKPGRDVHVGDSLQIQRGSESYEIIIKGINKQRRPAPEMELIYEETAASIESRRQLARMRELAAGTRMAPKRRPDKHERKHIVRFKRKQQ